MSYHTDEEVEIRDNAVRQVCQLIGELGDQYQLCPACFVIELMTSTAMFVTLGREGAPALMDIDEVLLQVKDEYTDRLANIAGSNTCH